MILLIEDDPSVSQLIAARLKGAGFEVETAGDGACALEFCKNRLPDLVILDILLPEIDGYTFLRRLRRDLGARHVPVIVLTAKDLRFREICDLEEIQGYITKPFRPEELIAKVNELHRKVKSQGGCENAGNNPSH